MAVAESPRMLYPPRHRTGVADAKTAVISKSNPVT